MTDGARQTAKWFERKFAFTFPVELHPNLCMRLRGAPARIEELVHEIPRERMIRKFDGKWSMQEQAGHLLDLEELWRARVEDFVSGARQLTAADLSNRGTDEANHNANELADILKEFRGARLKLLERLEQIDARIHGNTLLHPRLKQPMRLVDHLFFVAEHDDHHLVRMWELSKK